MSSPDAIEQSAMKAKQHVEIEGTSLKFLLYFPKSSPVIDDFLDVVFTRLLLRFFSRLILKHFTQGRLRALDLRGEDGLLGRQR